MRKNYSKIIDLKDFTIYYNIFYLQLLNSVLFELLQDNVFVSNTMIIFLNGLIHIDDRLALKSTTVQMNLEKEVEGRTFSSFSENLTFLLSCLKTGIILLNFYLLINFISRILNFLQERTRNG